MAMTNNLDPLLVDPLLLRQAEQLSIQRVKNDPTNRGLIRSLAEVYRKMGSPAEAAATYERLHHLDSHDKEAEYMQAVLGGKEWPQARTGLRAAPFVLLKDFLAREFHDALLPFVTSIPRDKFVPALVESSGYTPNLRASLDLSDKWQGRKQFQDRVREILPCLIPRLQVAPFTIGHIEVYLLAYQDGHFFRVHTDSAPNNPALVGRTVSFVYFFHRIPRSYTGGDLLLFDSDVETGEMASDRFTRVVPEDNSIIFFPSNFFHSVVPVRCPSREFADSRFVINGFVRKGTEPGASGAPAGRGHNP